MQVFGDWEVGRKIGDGAAGSVYELHKEGYGVNAVSALKVVSIPKNQAEFQEKAYGMSTDSAKAYFRNSVDTITKEIKVMITLAGHPNIVTYHDHMVIKREDSFGWDVLIRMELLTPFVNHINNRIISEQEIKQIARDLCSALSFCHKRNILHRDIKPANVFVDSDGRYKLGDFGIAKQVNDKTSGRTRVGTPNYIAPEVYNKLYDENYDERIDIYSLGILLYQLANNGSLPFVNDACKEQDYDVEISRAFALRMAGHQLPPPKGCSQELASFILKACAFYPDDRYQSADEMLLALDKPQSAARFSDNTQSFEHRYEKTQNFGQYNSDPHRNDTLKDKKGSAKPLLFVALGLTSCAAIAGAVWGTGRMNRNHSESEIISESNTDIQSITEAITEVLTEPATEPVTERVTEVPVEPVTEHITEATTEVPSEPVTEHVTEVTTQAVTEPVIVEPVITADLSKYAEHNGHYYKIYSMHEYNLNTWDAVTDFCASKGGYPAVINSEEENQWLYQYVLSNGLSTAFFGYTDRSSEGQWTWDGDTSAYTNWGVGQPNNTITDKHPEGEQYAQFWVEAGDGSWNDNHFQGKTKAFLCEWSAPEDILDGSTTVETPNDINIEIYQDEISFVYQDHTYAFVNYKRADITNWKDLLNYCEKRNCYPVTINSYEENQVIFQYIENYGFSMAYIGYTDEEQHGTWKWCHGDSSFVNWGEGRPNNKITNKYPEGEHYTQFMANKYNGTWNDVPFGINSDYVICEWDSPSNMAH